MTDLLLRVVRRLEALPEDDQIRQATLLLERLDALEALRNDVDTELARLGGDGAATLRDDPAVGMWRDRADVVDSVDFVRTLRRAEWEGR